MIRYCGARSSSLFVSILATLATAAAASAGEPPTVRFDLPTQVVAHDVVQTATPSASRLIEVAVPVSAQVTGGDVRKVQEISIEIDGGCAGLVVHDFAPQTALSTELAGDIQVTTTTEKGRTFSASLGGQSPIPLGDVVAQVTPSLSTSSKNHVAETQTTQRLSPKRPVVVSGTLNEGRGVFFQLRPSSQTTLEGQHTLSVVFRVPADWSAGHLNVRCWARGERQILWFDQPQVWGSTRRTVEVSLAGIGHPSLSAKRHLVAKQPTETTGDNWVPAKTVSE